MALLHRAIRRPGTGASSLMSVIGDAGSDRLVEALKFGIESEAVLSTVAVVIMATQSSCAL